MLELRYLVCSSWTYAQWSIFYVKKKVYKRKVGVVSPTVNGSSLVMSAVQAEVQGEHVPYASQPHYYHDMCLSGCESSLPPLFTATFCCCPGFPSVGAPVAALAGISSLPSSLPNVILSHWMINRVAESESEL